MPILDLIKKKDTGKKEEVPDELPDLPQAAENVQNVQNPAGMSVPDELPPVELAPDELPPVGGISPTPAMSENSDKRLYFSTVLQKLQEEGVKSTKLTSSSANLLGDMKKHWKQVKRQDELNEMRRKVVESITPLQQLEQEWVELQEDIEQKKKLMREKEEKIRVLAEEAKSLALKAEKTVNQKKDS